MRAMISSISDQPTVLLYKQRSTTYAKVSLARSPLVISPCGTLCEKPTCRTSWEYFLGRLQLTPLQCARVSTIVYHQSISSAQSVDVQSKMVIIHWSTIPSLVHYVMKLRSYGSSRLKMPSNMRGRSGCYTYSTVRPRRLDRNSSSCYCELGTTETMLCMLMVKLQSLHLQPSSSVSITRSLQLDTQSPMAILIMRVHLGSPGGQHRCKCV
jgi:hypothetical protein